MRSILEWSVMCAIDATPPDHKCTRVSLVSLCVRCRSVRVRVRPFLPVSVWGACAVSLFAAHQRHQRAERLGSAVSPPGQLVKGETGRGFLREFARDIYRSIAISGETQVVVCCRVKR
jgi:hypothetical protein